MGIIKIFTGLFTGDFSLMWEGAKQLFFGAIQAIWNYMNLIFIGRILKGIGAFLKLLKTSFKGGLDSIRLNWMYFKDKVIAIVSGFVNSIKTWFTNAKNSAIGIFNTIRLQVSLIIGQLKNNAINILKNMVSNFKSNFNSIKTTATSIFNGVKNAIMNPINAAKNAVLKALSSIKSAFSGLKLKLPKISVPKFRIKNWSMNPKNWIKAPPYIDIDWNARGAFFDQATALQGLGEKGTEAIIPIQNRRFMQPFSQAIAENLAAMTGAGGGQRIEIPVVLNNREILRAILPDLDRELAKRQHRQSGLVNRGNL